MRLGYAFRDGAASLAFLLLGQACAAGIPRSAPTQAPEPRVAWQDDGDLAVGADFLWDSERQRAVLGADLGARGILPVHVVLRNRASRSATVRRDDMRLELTDGTQLPPIEPAAVAGPEPRFAAGLCILLPVVCVVEIPLMVIAAIVDAPGKAKAAHAARVRDYVGKSLPATVSLEKNRPLEGFVFFTLAGAPAEVIPGAPPLRATVVRT